MSLYEILLKHLQVAEQIGQIKEINMRGKNEYMPDGFYITGDTRYGKVFTLEFEIVDKEEKRAEELE